jgi:hypothetical protein
LYAPSRAIQAKRATKARPQRPDAANHREIAAKKIFGVASCTAYSPTVHRISTAPRERPSSLADAAAV